MQGVEDRGLSTSSPQLTQAERAWRAPVALLASQLAFARQAWVRQRINTLYAERPRLQGPELLEKLSPLVTEVVRDLAEVYAEALGCDPEAVLHFLDPVCMEVELEGRRGVCRLLGRLWGGRHQVCIETRAQFQLRWPGPLPAQLIPLAGEVAANGYPIAKGKLAKLPVGTELKAAQAAIIAFSSLHLGRLLDLALEAGIKVNLVGPATSGPTPTVIPTAAGVLTLQSRLATLNGRRVRLTAMETRLLHILAERGGNVAPRAELAKVLGVPNTRALDRLVVGIRNALGDGVVATVYGAGYALEV